MCDMANFARVGKTLRVTLAPAFPNTFKNEAGKWIGADIEFLSIIEKKWRIKSQIMATGTAKQNFALVRLLNMGSLGDFKVKNLYTATFSSLTYF